MTRHQSFLGQLCIFERKQGCGSLRQRWGLSPAAKPWGGLERLVCWPSMALSPCRSPRLSFAQTGESIANWGVFSLGEDVVMGPAVSLRSPWGAAEARAGLTRANPTGVAVV